ncbi:MAG: glycoside hydrolase family 15 protein, partial [Nonomuraea sp.]|nr:glycoside hydrolase family 15 protein [Nonomuraea sp.]
EMGFTMDLQPRFDYGRRDHEVALLREGAVFTGGGLSLTLHLGEGCGRLEREGTGVRLSTSLSAGELTGVVLESLDVPPRRITRAEFRDAHHETTVFWRDWTGRSSYRGRWRESVGRSAMALKLMTYAPTGALVAAPTAGLPEQVGGERNWDYRYTWIRDASFSLHALLGLGYVEEAAAFANWLRDRATEHAGDRPLKIMYRVDGSSDLAEETLGHFEGYRGSRPVRIGNGAADQLQLDVYGELMYAAHLADSRGFQTAHAGWTALMRMMGWLCENWDRPEEGIWETRGGRKDFTYGRLMSWVAFDRAVRLARSTGRPADLGRLLAERDRVYDQIMERGWSPRRRSFVQHYDGDVLDASLLLMPAVGFISPQDPLWLSTLDAMDDNLVSDSLVYRYDPGASPDGLRGDEGTFTLCTFWYVEALTRTGRLNQARLAFEQMLTYASPLGLYAEEIGLTGEQLGNFPQAFSHLALINAAVILDHHLDHGTPWTHP